MNAGDVIAGRYRLEHLLGRGGMGEVWSAMHSVTEQRRALKFVQEDDEGARKRTLREARAASAVRHPNVVAVHDVIEGPDGAPVLVMDLLEGETLADKLEREKRLAPKEAVTIARAMLSALEAAHALGIVHRDLKPANVFLSPDPKLLDFGVAKLTAESGPARATNLLTESGALVGTPCYMAPEQAFGDGVVDAKSDLWSVGAVLYELLSGVRPADGENMGQVFKVLATNAIVPLESRVSGLPPALTTFVGQLLSSNRDLRPASAHAAREALEAIDVDNAIATPTSRPDSTAGNAAISIRRASTKRVPMMLAGAVVVGLAVFGGLKLRSNAVPATAAPPPPPASVVIAPEPAPTPSAAPAPTVTASAATKIATPKPKPKASAAIAPTPAPTNPNKLLTDPTF